MAGQMCALASGVHVHIHIGVSAPHLDDKNLVREVIEELLIHEEEAVFASIGRIRSPGTPCAVV